MKTRVCDEGRPHIFAQEFLWMEMAQRTFPWAEDDIGVLDDKYRLFMRTCEAVIKPLDLEYARWKGNGRKPADRLSICKAFILKMTLNIPTTKDLVSRLQTEPLARRLCGWSTPGAVPSESRFSVVFAEFARLGFVAHWYEDFVAQNHGDIHVDTVSYDSAPIPVRARAVATRREVAEWDPDQPEPPSRLPEQPGRSAQENLSDLPQDCDWGCKLDSHGKKKNWKGGKLHVAVTSAGFPVAWAYTSASMHDSQAMIPLAQQAAERVPHYFDLADAAYDSRIIRSVCEELGTIPLIDVNRRWNGDAAHNGMSLTEAKIYEQRTSAERFFSHVLDSHGGKTVRVKLPEKIVLHLGFGMLVVAVEQFVRMMC